MSKTLSWKLDPGRRSYACEWCDEEIVRGEVHYRCRGTWQCRRQDWHMHVECYEAGGREEPDDSGFVPHVRARGMTLAETLAARGGSWKLVQLDDDPGGGHN